MAGPSAPAPVSTRPITCPAHSASMKCWPPWLAARARLPSMCTASPSIVIASGKSCRLRLPAGTCRRLAPQRQMLAKKVEMRLGRRRVPSVTAGDLRQQQDGQQTEDRMLDVAPAVVLDPGKGPTNSRQHALSPTGLNACGYGRQITAARWQ